MTSVLTDDEFIGALSSCGHFINCIFGVNIGSNNHSDIVMESFNETVMYSNEVCCCFDLSINHLEFGRIFQNAVVFLADTFERYVKLAFMVGMRELGL